MNIYELWTEFNCLFGFQISTRNLVSKPSLGNLVSKPQLGNIFK